MGLIGRIFGLGRAAEGVGQAVSSVAEVFVGNRAAREAADHTEFVAAMGQFGTEFAQPRQGWFSAFVDGLNRLPRPALASGTLGLFAYAMADPVGFGERMQGLALVPEPLWWLLGAIVSFYFGARELHHLRTSRPSVSREAVATAVENIAELRKLRPAEPAEPAAEAAPDVAADANPALAEWRAERMAAE
ncbi:MAG: holin family protein [Pseudomonadota bacterium]